MGLIRISKATWWIHCEPYSEVHTMRTVSTDRGKMQGKRKFRKVWQNLFCGKWELVFFRSNLDQRGSNKTGCSICLTWNFFFDDQNWNFALFTVGLPELNGVANKTIVIPVILVQQCVVSGWPNVMKIHKKLDPTSRRSLLKWERWMKSLKAKRALDAEWKRLMMNGVRVWVHNKL